MTVAFVQAGTPASSTSNNLTVTLPAGWTAGNLAIAYLYGISGTAWGAPAGWSVLETEGTVHAYAIYYRFLVGGDTNPTFTYTSTQRHGGVICEYSGVHSSVWEDLTNPVSHTNPDSLARKATDIAANVTTRKVGMAVSFFGFSYNSTLFPYAAGLDQGFGSDRVAYAVGSGTNLLAIAVSDKDITNSYDGIVSPTRDPNGNSYSTQVTFFLPADEQPNVFRAYRQGGAGTAVHAETNLPWFVGAGTGVAVVANNITIPLPTNWEVGHYAMAVITPLSGTIATLTGWTKVLETTNSSNRSYVFTRFLEGGDTNPTFVGSSNSGKCGFIVAYGGVDTITPIDTTLINNTDAYNGNPVKTIDLAPELTTYRKHKAVAIAQGTYYTTDWALSDAQGFIRRVNVSYGGTTSNTSAALADRGVINSHLGVTTPTWDPNGSNTWKVLSTFFLVSVNQPNLFRATNQSTTATALLKPSIPYHIATSAVVGGSGTSLALTLPAGWQEGDFAIAVINTVPSSTVTPPAGWTLFTSAQETVANQRRTYIYYRFLVGGDTNPTFTSTGSSIKLAFIVTYGNVNPTYPFDPTVLANTTSPYDGTPLKTPDLSAETLTFKKVTALSLVTGGNYTTDWVYTIQAGFSAPRAAGSIGVTTSNASAEMSDKGHLDGYTPLTVPTWDPNGSNTNKIALTLFLVAAEHPNVFKARRQASTAVTHIHTQWPEYINRGTTYLASSGTAWTVALPPILRAGDVMILVLALDGGGMTTTTPTGWTLIGPVRNSSTDRLYVWWKVAEEGEVAPAATISSSSTAWRTGVIFSFEHTRRIDAQVLYGLDQGNPQSTTSSTDKPSADLSVTDTYQEAWAVWMADQNFTGLKAGSEQGYASHYLDSPTNVKLFIARRRTLGTQVITGPTAVGTNSRSMYIGFSVEGMFQPKNIAALALQGTDADVVITAEEGFPIEAYALQGQLGTQLTMKSFRPKFRKPRRELIWVTDYNGDKVAVID